MSDLLCHEISVFVLNSQGQFLLQKRSTNKKYFPNMWALCTGHVENGESPKEAALREVKEELGITVSLDHLYSFASGKFDSQTTYFFSIICNLSSNEFAIQKEELSEVRWFNVDTLINMIKSHDDTIVYRENKLDLFLALEDYVNHYVLQKYNT